MHFSKSPFHVICDKESRVYGNRTTHVHFNNGHLVVTNNYVLAAMPLGSDELNGYCIRADHYKVIYSSLSIEVTEINGENWLMADNQICVPLEKSQVFPEWSHFFEQEKKPIDSIMINQEFVAMASKVLLSNELRFSFSDKNNGVIISNFNTDIKVLIMPVYSHND